MPIRQSQACPTEIIQLALDADMPKSCWEHLAIRDRGDMTVVAFKSRIVSDDEAFREVVDFVHQRGRTRLILNFENVEYFSSSGLSMLVTLHRTTAKMGGSFSLSNVAPEIRELLEITKLDRIIEIVSVSLGPDDEDGEMGSAPAPLIYPKPSGGANIALQPPSSQGDS